MHTAAIREHAVIDRHVPIYEAKCVTCKETSEAHVFLMLDISHSPEDIFRPRMISRVPSTLRRFITASPIGFGRIGERLANTPCSFFEGGGAAVEPFLTAMGAYLHEKPDILLSSFRHCAQ